MSKGKYKIPFSENGSLMHFADQTFYKAAEWRDNYTFEATLEYVGLRRGRSAACFVVKDRNGCKYSMFMKDMEGVILKGQITEGEMFGTWTFTKRGSNYGIQYVA